MSLPDTGGVRSIAPAQGPRGPAPFFISETEAFAKNRGTVYITESGRSYDGRHFLKTGFFGTVSGKKFRDHISLGLIVWLLACVVFHPLVHLEAGRDDSETGRVRFCAAHGGGTEAVLHEEFLPCPLCSGFDETVCSSGEQSVSFAEHIPQGRPLPDEPSRPSLPELPAPRGPPAI